MKNTACSLFALPLLLVTSPAHAKYSGTAEIKRVCAAALLQQARDVHENYPEMSVADNLVLLIREIEEIATKWTPEGLRDTAESGFELYPVSEVCVAKAVLRQREAASGHSSTGAAMATLPVKVSAVPPLRPTVTQEANNPAGEATDCVRVIYSEDFEVEHVSSTMKAAFRNRCSRPVEVTWCTVSGDCHPGYTNLATVPARKDRGFSYEPSVRGSKVAYAACYNGFVPHQGELSKKLNHACK